MYKEKNERNFFASLQTDVNFNVAELLVNVIRDKREIIDRISPAHIERFVRLLIETQVRIPLRYIHSILFHTRFFLALSRPVV